jgi:hypothetical protein
VTTIKNIIKALNKIAQKPKEDKRPGISEFPENTSPQTVDDGLLTCSESPVLVCYWGWIDNQALCHGDSATIHTEGSITNPQGEMRPLYGTEPHAEDIYDPNVSRWITVNRGDRIRIRFVAKGRSHSLTQEDNLPDFPPWIERDMTLSFLFGDEAFSFEDGFEIKVNGVAIRPNNNYAVPLGTLLNAGDEAIVEFQVPMNAELGYDNKLYLRHAGSFNSAPDRIYKKTCFQPGGRCNNCSSTMWFGIRITE